MAYLAPDTIGGGHYLAPDEPPSQGNTPIVTGMTANPTVATVAGGSVTSVAIAVQGTNNPGQGFTSAKFSGFGSVTGGDITMPTGTSSSQSGVFRFTSTQDPTWHVDVTLTVAAVVVTPPSVTSVAISPTSTTANGGSTLQLTATAQGNNPPQTFNWTIDGGSVSSSGLVQLPGATSSAQTIHATATSTLNSNASATCTITVPAASAAALATQVVVEFEKRNGVEPSNLAGLGVSVFREAVAGQLGAPIVNTVATLNGAGKLVIDITGLGLHVHDVVGVAVYKGTPSPDDTNQMGWFGPAFAS